MEESQKSQRGFLKSQSGKNLKAHLFNSSPPDSKVLLAEGLNMAFLVESELYIAAEDAAQNQEVPAPSKKRAPRKK